MEELTIQIEDLTIEVTDEMAGERIDKAVSSIDEDWSRSQIANWVKEGAVRVNGEIVKPNYKVRLDDVIIVTPPVLEELDVVPEDLDLEIVYEDADVLVVNKPKGMVVHPAPGHAYGTLVNGLMHHCTDLSGINGVVRPGIVHRIDKDTSGLLMVAKNDAAHTSLVNQLVRKSVTRKYIALVHGHIPHDKGTIEAPIARDPRERQNMAVVDKGKHAVTHFRVLERFGDFTLVECRLETGRTHQIRVHMKYIGFPLVGDPKYGPRKTMDIGGQALHAEVIGFDHPKTGEYMEFSAEMPEYFAELLESLRKKD
ncbi:RluA family pseudouridine synthase [Planococcus sp. CAU13]|uniref:RluA family pseudouridine synthase n=1 Tax=Planococcus sp. CAU13 TaxID=1541197 RepID=UPI000A9A26EA